MITADDAPEQPPKSGPDSVFQAENGSERASRRRRPGCWIAAAVLVVVIVVAAKSPAGRAIINASKYLLDKSDAGTALYKGDSKDRLIAIYTAATLYHQSEEKFPKAATWCDDVLSRMKTGDLKAGEAEKKLVRPGTNPGEFGYSINADIAEKYRGDLASPQIILFFESTATDRNAAGDPKIDGLPGGQAVLLDGTVVQMER